MSKVEAKVISISRGHEIRREQEESYIREIKENEEKEKRFDEVKSKLSEIYKKAEQLEKEARERWEAEMHKPDNERNVPLAVCLSGHRAHFGSIIMEIDNIRQQNAYDEPIVIEFIEEAKQLLDQLKIEIDSHFSE